MAQDEFLQALTAAYREHPCQVLPNALWKTTTRIGEFQTAVRQRSGQVQRLEAWDENSLYVYWQHEDRQPGMLLNRRLNFLQLALMHQDFLDAPTVAGFTTFQPYFRMCRRDLPGAGAALPEGFRFAEVEPLNDVQAAAEFINACYDDMDVTPEKVRNWALHPVYAPDLWVWVVDEATGERAALGIAEMDHEIGEVSLEWVQTLPTYRRRGLGRALVAELLARSGAAFATVSGENRDDLRAFYRACGFSGDDVWWLLGR